jgi:DivIVA domain-containing protein
VVFLEVVVAAAVLFAIGAVVAVRRRELSPAGRDSTDSRIPPASTAMAPNDVDALRFGLAFRGYRMDQVDDALDRLREELRLRDERLAALADASSMGRPRPRVWSPPDEEPSIRPATVVTATEAVTGAGPVKAPEPVQPPLAAASAQPEPAAGDLPTGPPPEPEQPVDPPRPAPSPSPAAAPTPAPASGEDRISKLRRPRPAPEL